jgi:hypothetical protein
MKRLPRLEPPPPIDRRFAADGSSRSSGLPRRSSHRTGLVDRTSGSSGWYLRVEEQALTRDRPWRVQSVPFAPQ